MSADAYDSISTSDYTTVLDAFYNENNAATQQIISYNRFVHSILPTIIAGNSHLEYVYTHPDTYDTCAVELEILASEITYTCPLSDARFAMPDAIPIKNGYGKYATHGDSRTDTPSHAAEPHTREFGPHGAGDEPQSNGPRSGDVHQSHHADDKVVTQRKPLYPYEARIRRCTYDSRLFTSVTFRRYKFSASGEKILVDQFDIPDIYLADVPVMVRSDLCNLMRTGERLARANDKEYEFHLRNVIKECEYDHGGYFIIGGVEKGILLQEKRAINTIYVFPQKMSAAQKVDANSSDVAAATGSGDNDNDKIYISSNIEHHLATAEIVSVDADSGENRMMKVMLLTIMTNKALDVLDNVIPHARQYIRHRDSTVVVTCKINRFGTANGVMLPILLRALGMTQDLQIMMFVTQNHRLYTAIDQDTSERSMQTASICRLMEETMGLCEQYRDREACIEYIGQLLGFKGTRNDCIEATYNFLINRFLPHINGTRGLLIRKARYLCLMANRLSRCVLGFDTTSQRDGFGSKRADSTGELLGILFRKYMMGLKKSFADYMKRSIESTTPKKTQAVGTPKHIRDFFLVQHRHSSVMRYAIATGNWCMTHGQSYALPASAKGISQTMNTLNYHAKQSMLNRTINPMNDQSKDPKPRQLHSTQWGLCCPSETPEGHKIGIVKNMSSTTHLSIGIANHIILQCLLAMNRCDLFSRGRKPVHVEIFDDITEDVMHEVFYAHDIVKHTALHLNGDIVGYTETPKEFLDTFRVLRRFGSVLFADDVVWHLPLDCSVAFDTMKNTISIRSDAGRFCRPLLVVDPHTHKATLLKKHHLLYFEAANDPYADDKSQAARNGHGDSPQRLNGHGDSPQRLNGHGDSPQRRNGHGDSPQRRNGHGDSSQSARDVRESLYQQLAGCFHEIIGEMEFNKTSGDALAPQRVVERIMEKYTREMPEAVRGVLRWRDMFRLGFVEMLDTEETETAMVAMYPEDIAMNRDYCQTYTHCEIHPSTILGLSSSLIPFPDRNQSPRITYQSAMGKQAQGLFSTRQHYRIDGTTYTLWYPQKPIVTTYQANKTHYRELPQGQNAIVAIACYGGYNQEDSVLINQSSVDRGFMRSETTSTFSAICKRSVVSKTASTDAISQEFFEKPDPKQVLGVRLECNYGKLDSDGMPQVGQRYSAGDVIVGKVLVHERRTVTNFYHRQNGRHGPITYCKTDQSFIWRKTKTGICESVVRTVSEKGESLVHVKMRSTCEPEIGDKFCLTADHDVLTLNDGWKSITQVTEEDLVATMDSKTHHLDYIHPARVLSFDHNDDVYCISNQQVDTKVTLNHRMYVLRRDHKEYEFLEAEKIIGKRVRYKKDCINAKDDVTSIQFGDETYDFEAFIKFFGVWLAEGWCDKPDYRVSFSVNKPRVQQLLRETSDAMGLHYYETKDSKFIFYKKNLWEFLKPLSVGAPRKYIPRIFLEQMGQKNCRDMIYGMLCGDGGGKDSQDTNTLTEYFTSSRQLADDFQQLCLHAGWSATIALSKPAGNSTTLKDGRVITSNHWKCGVVKTRNRPQVNHGHVHQQKVQLEGKEHYKGTVYCLEMPPHGLFYVRRNGKTMWTGNSSRYGQKGTCGMLYRQEDMPFTAEGITPDIIVNPHAIPSRMTIGQIFESVAAKTAMFSDRTEVDATAFSPCTASSISDVLLRMGYQCRGYDRLYNGHTGQPLAAMIFIGPTFYQRLKHMAHDKIQSRAKGPMQKCIRQPTHGKSRGGAIRFGEMERDAILAHGGAHMLYDRLMQNSDAYQVYVCNDCGLICEANLTKHEFLCRRCRNTTSISRVNIPYAFKTMIQELMGMGIAPRLALENVDYV